MPSQEWAYRYSPALDSSHTSLVVCNDLSLPRVPLRVEVGRRRHEARRCTTHGTLLVRASLNDVFALAILPAPVLDALDVCCIFERTVNWLRSGYIPTNRITDNSMGLCRRTMG